MLIRREQESKVWKGVSKHRKKGIQGDEKRIVSIHEGILESVHSGKSVRDILSQIASVARSQRKRMHELTKFAVSEITNWMTDSVVRNGTNDTSLFNLSRARQYCQREWVAREKTHETAVLRIVIVLRSSPCEQKEKDDDDPSKLRILMRLEPYDEVKGTYTSRLWVKRTEKESANVLFSWEVFENFHLPTLKAAISAARWAFSFAKRRFSMTLLRRAAIFVERVADCSEVRAVETNQRTSIRAFEWNDRG